MIAVAHDWTGRAPAFVGTLDGGWEEARVESERRIEATRPRDHWLNGNLLGRAFDFLLKEFPGDLDEIQRTWTPLEIIDFYLNAT